MPRNVISFIDIIKTKIIDKFSNKKHINNYQSSNSLILVMYFYFGTSFFFFTSCCIYYNVFMNEIIICKDGHEPSKQISFLYENFCLSYSKLLTGEFALFYRWVPWITTLCCILLYTPKILINKSSCNFTALYLMKINNLNNQQYFEGGGGGGGKRKSTEHYLDDRIENFLEDLISKLWNNSKSLYWKCLLVHIYTLFLNIFLIFLLDFLLQGRFILYVPNTFPFTRNMTHFSDRMTQIFYPFSECSIEPVIQGRTEFLTCHLTLMEFYEKIFFLVWLYLYILPIFTLIYIIYLISLIRDNYNYFLKHLLNNHLNYDLLLKCKFILLKKKGRKNDKVV